MLKVHTGPHMPHFLSVIVALRVCVRTGRAEDQFGRGERHHHHEEDRNEEDRNEDADQHAGDQVQSDV